MVVVPIGNVDPLGKPAVCVITNPAQLSVATGKAQPTTAEQLPGVLLTVMLSGHELNTGACKSVTVTVNVHNEEFPLASVAV